MNYLSKSWRRWVAWLLVASLFAVACVFLADWQLNRRGEKLAFINKIERNYDLPAAPLSSFASADGLFNLENEWRSATVSGRYLVKDLTLVRNRPNNGQPGFLELVPFQTDEGSIIVIERGWLATGNEQDYPDVVPLPIAEHLLLTGRIRLGEPKFDRGAPAGQIPSIDLSEMKKLSSVGNSKFFTKIYLRLRSESPASQGYPVSVSKPDIDEGNHLSYAFQWLAFGLMAFIALGWGMKQEIRIRRTQADSTYQPKRRRQPGDADNAAEDAALEAE
jgi:hypothetical protein